MFGIVKIIHSKSHIHINTQQGLLFSSQLTCNSSDVKVLSSDEDDELTPIERLLFEKEFSSEHETVLRNKLNEYCAPEGRDTRHLVNELLAMALKVRKLLMLNNERDQRLAGAATKECEHSPPPTPIIIRESPASSIQAPFPLPLPGFLEVQTPFLQPPSPMLLSPHNLPGCTSSFGRSQEKNRFNETEQPVEQQNAQETETELGTKNLIQKTDTEFEDAKRAIQDLVQSGRSAGEMRTLKEDPLHRKMPLLTGDIMKDIQIIASHSHKQIL